MPAYVRTPTCSRGTAQLAGVGSAPRGELFQTADSQDFEAGGCEFGCCHHSEAGGGFMVRGGDSQDVPAFPHTCVCRCGGSLSLARVARLSFLSS